MKGLLKMVNVIQNARGKSYLWIDSRKCIGCGTCKKTCHHDAVMGQPREPHRIDTEKCFRCYHCMEKCPKGAIELFTRE